MMSQWFKSVQPHEIRTHEELDFSNAVCDTEAKLPQEVLDLRLREGSPETQRGIWSTCNRLYRWVCMIIDCTAIAVASLSMSRIPLF